MKKLVTFTFWVCATANANSLEIFDTADEELVTSCTSVGDVYAWGRQVDPIRVEIVRKGYT